MAYKAATREETWAEKVAIVNSCGFFCIHFTTEEEESKI